jgi:hypothetical protein
MLSHLHTPNDRHTFQLQFQMLCWLSNGCSYCSRSATGTCPSKVPVLLVPVLLVPVLLVLVLLVPVLLVPVLLVPVLLVPVLLVLVLLVPTLLVPTLLVPILLVPVLLLVQSKHGVCSACDAAQLVRGLAIGRGTLPLQLLRYLFSCLHLPG